MMPALPSITHFAPASTLHVRVLGPESPTPSAADLRRLFAGRVLSRTRRERIASVTRLIVQHGARVIGLAAYDRADDELRVYELALDPSLCFGAQDILHQLLDGLEMACLAGGCQRVVLLPAAVVATTALERLGYEVVAEGCAGGWLEKRFA
jgi:hypothetical protein